MFTVIIAEKKHFDAIQKNKLYFKPFLDKCPEEFVFCEWRPEGQTLYESVPELVTTVGRHKSWRAVIVQSGRGDTRRNPFDDVSGAEYAAAEEEFRMGGVLGAGDESGAEGSAAGEFSDGSSFPEEEESFVKWKAECAEKACGLILAKEALCRKALSLPLQRLCSCLCFRKEESLAGSPETPVQDGKIVVEGNYGAEDAAEFMTELLHKAHLAEERMKNRLRGECVENMLPGDGMTRRLGSMGIVLPEQVICLAERTTESGFFCPADSWQTHTDFEYSAFVTRNMYYDKMRFLVFDILPETHKDYRYDKIRFLYDLFLLSLNEIPGGALLPRKLYCLESENDERPLRNLVTSYIRKLDATIAKVDSQIEAIKSEIPAELSDRDAESMFAGDVVIPVSMSRDFDENELLSTAPPPGLSADCPIDEYSGWYRSSRESDEALDRLVKQPRRSVKKAVDRVRLDSEVDCSSIRVLDEFQMDDVRDHTEESENAMATLHVPDIFNIARYHKQLDKESEEVKKVLRTRMKKKTTVILGAVCALLFVLCMLPLLTTNGGVYLLTALELIAAAAVMLLVSMGITLFCLRIPVKKAVSGFNETALGILAEVKGAMTLFSEYLSLVCRVRRGYRVLNFSENNLDIYDVSINTRKKHRIDMEKMRAMIVDGYGDFIDAFAPGRDILPYDYDFGRSSTEYSYEPPYLADDAVTIDYLEKGNTVRVPSAFVKSVSLRMEEIYDD